MTREEKMICKEFLNDADTTHSCNEYKLLMALLDQEPREITLEDVKEYCKPRCLTIITNELLYELTHPKIKALEQEPILDKIRAEIIEMTSDRGFLSCSVDHIHEEINAFFDKYKAESEVRNGSQN